jgi:hypothetical protein
VSLMRTRRILWSDGRIDAVSNGTPRRRSNSGETEKQLLNQKATYMILEIQY